MLFLVNQKKTGINSKFWDLYKVLFLKIDQLFSSLEPNISTKTVIPA